MSEDTENKLPGEFPEVVCKNTVELTREGSETTIHIECPNKVSEHSSECDNLPLKIEPKVVFEVGYCKPPKVGYFVKGVSGNPRGRPPGSRNKFSKQRLYEFVGVEGEREVFVREGDNKVILPTAQSIVRAVFKSARGGNIQAAKLAMEIMRLADIQEEREQEKDFVFAKRYQEYARSEMAKNPGLKFFPDPDEISFDERHRVVVFTGPRNQEEIQECDDQKFELLANPDGLTGGKRDDTIRKYIAAEEKRTGIKITRIWPELPVFSTSQYED